MIWNIIDKRDRPHRWAKINAIIEATSHDNGCKDADQAPANEDEVLYDQLEGVSLNQAVDWAHSQPTPVTLFLYDLGRGTT